MSLDKMKKLIMTLSFRKKSFKKLFMFRSTLIPDSPGDLDAGEQLRGEHMVSGSEIQPWNIFKDMNDDWDIENIFPALK